MKKRLNTFKILGTVLTATSLATTVSLASCSKKNTRFNAIGGEYDRQFGVSESTYKALKNQFVIELSNKLGENPETRDPEYIQKEITKLRKKMQIFDKKLADNTNYSYSLMTCSLVELANQEYGLKLVSESTAQWSDIDDFFLGFKKSFAAYMVATNVPPKVRDLILSHAWDEYQKLLYDDSTTPVTGIKTKYNDPLVALIKIKPMLITCFADTNDEIGLAAASNRLQQFFDDYSIELKKDDSNVKLDLLEPKLTIGGDLSDLMNSAFTVTRKSDDATVPFNNVEMIPGYTIRPILKNISRDEYANQYSLDVDWTCIKSSYENSTRNDKDKVTAHLFKGGKQYTPGATVQDLVDFSDPQTVSYSIELTPAKEAETLRNVYLSNKTGGQYLNYLDFKWDDNSIEKDKCCFDPFIMGKKVKHEGNTTTYLLDLQSLAASGLTAAVNERGSATNDSSNYVRLDNYISTGILDLTDETTTGNNDKEELLNDFLTNCALYSETTINDDATEDNNFATSKLQVKYKNSSYNLDSTVVIDKEFEHENYGESSISYYWLTEQYNKYIGAVDFYNTEVEKEWQSTQEAMAEFVIGFILSAILNATVVIFMVTEPIFVPVFVAMLVCILTSVACQIAACVLYYKHKYKPLKTFFDNTEKLKGSKEGGDFINFIIKSGTELGLLKADKYKHIDRTKYISHFNDYKKLPLSTKIEYLNKYQELPESKEYKGFLNKISEYHITAEDYNEIMDGWKPDNDHYRDNLGLEIGTIIADTTSIVLAFIPNNKKVSDDVVAKSEQTSETFEQVENSVRDIPQNESEVEVLKKETPEIREEYVVNYGNHKNDPAFVELKEGIVGPDGNIDEIVPFIQRDDVYYVAQEGLNPIIDTEKEFRSRVGENLLACQQKSGVEKPINFNYEGLNKTNKEPGEYVHIFEITGDSTVTRYLAERSGVSMEELPTSCNKLIQTYRTAIEGINPSTQTGEKIVRSLRGRFANLYTKHGNKFSKSLRSWLKDYTKQRCALTDDELFDRIVNFMDHCLSAKDYTSCNQMVKILLDEPIRYYGKAVARAVGKIKLW